MKMRRWSSRKSLSVLLLLTGVVVLGGMTNSWGATKNTRPAGALTAVRGATVNGVAAISGLTVFSGSRLKTAPRGRAALNLGSLGRIELAPDSELILRVADGVIGGELKAGQAIVSTPNGTFIKVLTTQGEVATSGTVASTLVINSSQERTSVLAARGDALLTAGSKVIKVPAGRIEILGLTGADGKLRSIAPNQNLNEVVARYSKPADQRQSVAVSFLTETISRTAASLAATRNSEQPGGLFYTGLTCKDFADTELCRRKSPTF